MAKIALDKYYTEEGVAERCVNIVWDTIGKDWERVIEPSSGTGVFLKYLPENTIAYDIDPPSGSKAIKADYREVQLPYKESSVVIGNPPFGRANKGSVQFIKASLKHSPYVCLIQPISQLNQNRTMKDTELLASVDLGKVKYSGRTVHTCFNIYHYCKDGHKQNWDIPGVTEFRHIFRSGKYQHSDDILNKPWTYRIAAWGKIRLLEEGETCPNEVVIMIDKEAELYDWIGKTLAETDYESIVKAVKAPNLPAWRLKKYLYEKGKEEGIF